MYSAAWQCAAVSFAAQPGAQPQLGRAARQWCLTRCCSTRPSLDACFPRGAPTYSAVHPREARASIVSLLQHSSAAAFPVHPVQSEQRLGNLLCLAGGTGSANAAVPPAWVPWPLHTQAVQAAHLVSSIAGVLLDLCGGHRC